jgi:hypothetical protein
MYQGGGRVKGAHHVSTSSLWSRDDTGGVVGELLPKKTMRWKSFVQCVDSVTASAWES